MFYIVAKDIVVTTCVYQQVSTSKVIVSQNISRQIPTALTEMINRCKSLNRLFMIKENLDNVK